MLQAGDRAYRRMTKIAQQCDPGAKWGDAFPSKPKWMRWRTCERLEHHHDLMALLGITYGSGAAREAEVKAIYATWRAGSGGDDMDMERRVAKIIREVRATSRRQSKDEVDTCVRSRVGSDAVVACVTSCAERKR
jgi:hypothetical protein